MKKLLSCALVLTLLVCACASAMAADLVIYSARNERLHLPVSACMAPTLPHSPPFASAVLCAGPRPRLPRGPEAARMGSMFRRPSAVLLSLALSALAAEGPEGLTLFFELDRMFCEQEDFTRCFLSGTSN